MGQDYFRCALSWLSGAALAETSGKVVRFNLIDLRGAGRPIGQVTFEQGKWGLLITPERYYLPPCRHGLHIHENPPAVPARRRVTVA